MNTTHGDKRADSVSAPPTVAQAEVAQLLRLANESLLFQFSSICEGALIVDRHARICWMNEKYPRRLGLSDPAAAIGQPVEMFLPNSQMREVVESGQPIMLDIMDFGAESFVVLRLPLRDAHGHVQGALGLMLLDNAKSLAPLVSRYHQLHRELADTRHKLAEARRAKYTLGSLVGASEAWLLLKTEARRAARTQASVLILGETGTGKELLAQAIHNASLRADRPFVAVNIAAVPEALLEAEFFGAVAGAYTGADRKGRDGKFKLAEGGTLFLDEIGDMAVPMQAKLLRVLQEGEYEALGSDRLLHADVRIVAATSRDLQAEVSAGRFRADLYYRLNVVTLSMPPLRQRLDDLPLLCEHLMEKLCRRLGLAPHELAPEALQRLGQHDWPGNVRELQNVLERALMMADDAVVSASAVQRILPLLPAAPPATVAANSPSLAEAVAQAERQAIRDALRQCDGNKARAASLLGISRTSLYEKITALELV